MNAQSRVDVKTGGASNHSEQLQKDYPVCSLFHKSVRSNGKLHISLIFLFQPNFEEKNEHGDARIEEFSSTVRAGLITGPTISFGTVPAPRCGGVVATAPAGEADHS
jgi:hypothetical protein